MQVFVYEYTCSGGWAGLAEGSSLRTEGRAMLAALLDDFRRAPGLTPITLLHESCPPVGGQTPARRLREEDEASAFQELARKADYTLIIAPESDDLLVTRCRWVEEAGSCSLGSSPAVVRLTGDKLALGEHLQRQGVPTPTCQEIRAGAIPPNVTFPVVWKPRYGAGSQATFLVRDPEGLTACAETARLEGFCGEAIVQPYFPGIAAGVAFLAGPRQTAPLLPAAQHLSQDGRFHYQGGSIPLPAGLAERAERLGRRAVGAVPGLRGYVGVDIMLGEAADGSRDAAIEINPRLTTSYVGLRALAETNLAEALLRVATGAPFGELSWHPGEVCFRSDGSIERAVGSEYL
jgi:predicted ATP-grasp superfamily ATP-dependent carboligase